MRFINRNDVIDYYGGGTFKQVLIDGGVGIQLLKCLKVQRCLRFY